MCWGVDVSGSNLHHQSIALEGTERSSRNSGKTMNFHGRRRIQRQDQILARSRLLPLSTVELPIVNYSRLIP
jgi:hypothetical protein